MYSNGYVLVAGRYQQQIACYSYCSRISILRVLQQAGKKLRCFNMFVSVLYSQYYLLLIIHNSILFEM